MLLEKHFYRRFGLRKAQHLTAPIINDLSVLELPRASVFHFLPEDVSQKGITPDHWAVKNSERLVYSEHVVEYSPSATNGKPRRNNVVAMVEIKEYHKRYRKIKMVRDLVRNSRDPKSTLVLNYALVDDLYRYTPTIYTEHHRRLNILTTLTEQLDQFSEQVADRHHYFTLELPDVLPSLTMLRWGREEITLPLIETFNTLEYLLILELWKWLSDSREFSLFNLIKVENYSKINLVIIRDNRWMVINLAKLDEWRNGSEEDGDVNPEALAKHFLMLLVKLFQATSSTTDLSDSELVAIKGETVLTNPSAINTDSTTEDPALIEETPEDSVIESLNVKNILKDDSKDSELESQLDTIRENDAIKKRVDGVNPFENVTPLNTEEILNKKSEALFESGYISIAELKKSKDLFKTQESLKNPFNGTESLMNFAKVDPTTLEIKEPTKLPETLGVLDPSMLLSTVESFDSEYIAKVHRKDVVGSVLAVNNAGVIVTDYQVDLKEDIANNYEIHTIKLKPIQGKPSTIRFKLPVLAPDGSFVSDGVKYRLRKQRSDMPIRKVNPSRVALSSYYGKVFVDRSTKVVSDYGKWLLKSLMDLSINPDDTRLSKVKMGSVLNTENTTPRVYSIIASEFGGFSVGDLDFSFDYSKRASLYGTETLKTYEKSTFLVCGKSKTGFILVDQNDTFYLTGSKDPEVLGPIEVILELNRTKAPVDIAELKVYSAVISVGFVLAYYLGLSKLIASLDGKVRKFAVTDTINLGDDEYKIVFADYILVVNRNNKLQSLILGGLNNYKNTIKRFNYKDFETQDVYYNLLEDVGLGNRQLKELRLMQSMFIDPITLELLKELNEPTTLIGLLKRASELLLQDYSASETDLRYMRIRGYERLSGAVYSELVNSLRGHLAREGSQNAIVEMNPYAVWKAISEDPAKVIVEESNPIKNINEKESVTFMGAGGRGRDSMVDRTRLFSDSDLGTISESTVDSGDVAINTNTVANPKYKNLRGVTTRYDATQDGSSSVISTGALLSPAADMDDPKRVNFITIQHAQGISAVGYTTTPLRTGYEKVIAHRTGDLFATTAKQKGRVLKLTENSITVELDDGTTQSIELGIRHGVAAGSVYEHTLKTDLKEGQRFEPGTALAYNSGFFQPDPLKPNEVIWTAGVMVKTAILESSDTFEDSSVISERVSKLLTSPQTKVRQIFLSFDQTVTDLLKVGTKVDPETILCTLEDSFTADNSVFDEEVRKTLRMLAGNAPKAKYHGVITKMECIYYGDPEDMSPSIRALADRFDKALVKKRKSLGLAPIDNSVSDGLRIDNKPLELDTLVLKVYITDGQSSGVGDKYFL